MSIGETQRRVYIESQSNLEQVLCSAVLLHYVVIIRRQICTDKAVILSFDEYTSHATHFSSKLKSYYIYTVSQKQSTAL